MKIFGKAIILILLIPGMLIACNLITPTPEAPPATETEVPAPTPLPPSPIPPTPTEVPATEPIVFYYFVAVEEQAPPEGSVVVMPDTYILAPELSELVYSSDTALDLRLALELMLNDGRNGWTSTNLDIVEAVFNAGHASVILQGDYFGVGDVTLIAARTQILLTVFANPSIQTATITLNGDTIGNLGISNSLMAKPADYVFTRAEIEAYQAENLYVSP